MIWLTYTRLCYIPKTYILVEQRIDILDKRYLLHNLCYSNILSLCIQFFHRVDFRNSHRDKYRMVGVGLAYKQRFFHKLQVPRIHSYILFDQKQGHLFYRLPYQHNSRCFYIFPRGHKLLLGIRESLDIRCSCYILEHICRWHKLGWINSLERICRVL